MNPNPTQLLLKNPKSLNPILPMYRRKKKIKIMQRFWQNDKNKFKKKRKKKPCPEVVLPKI
jgi:hypothetical protein